LADRKRGIDTSGIDSIVGYRLRRAQTAVFARFLPRFAPARLTPADYAALVVVADNPGVRPSDVAAALGMQRANFAALAASLEDRRLIERRAGETDRRSHALFLTADGDILMAAVRKVHAKFESEIVAALGGPEARDRLVAALKKLD
jgi:DNA-binding MarR family transcriptional regulator